MPRSLSIFLKMALAFVGILWFNMDGLNEDHGMLAPKNFRLGGVGSQVMVLLCLVLSAVYSVADFIVGSS